MKNSHTSNRKPSKLLIGAFIATAFYVGYKQVVFKYDIRTPEGAANLVLGDINKYNQFWRSISNTDHCTPISSITSETTYVDLLSSAYHCIIDSNYDAAAENYVLSFAMGNFDKNRVQNHKLNSAADYVFMKFAEEFYTPSKGISYEFKQLNLAVKRLEEGSRREAYCAEVKSLTIPSYTPNYMLTFDADKSSYEDTTIPISYTEPEQDIKEQYWNKALSEMQTCR